MSRACRVAGEVGGDASHAWGKARWAQWGPERRLRVRGPTGDKIRRKEQGKAGDESGIEGAYHALHEKTKVHRGKGVEEVTYCVRKWTHSRRGRGAQNTGRRFSSLDPTLEGAQRRAASQQKFTRRKRKMPAITEVPFHLKNFEVRKRGIS